MVQAVTATRPTKKSAGKRTRVEQEPYIDARQHVRNIAVLVSFEEMQNYVAKHDLYQPGRGDRFTKEEAKLIEDALDEKAEELRAEGEAKGNGHDKTPATGEELTGMQLFTRVKERLLEAKDLTDYNLIVEEHDLNGLIDGGKDARLIKTDAAKLRRMLTATCERLPPAETADAGSVYAGDDAAALIETTEREQRGRWATLQQVLHRLDQEHARKMPRKKHLLKLNEESDRLREEYFAVYSELADAVGEERANEVRARVEAKPEPCPNPDCGHTDEEHSAFDRGVKDGEGGVDMHANPYEEPELREAWSSGHSAGSMNRAASPQSADAGEQGATPVEELTPATEYSVSRSFTSPLRVRLTSDEIEQKCDELDRALAELEQLEKRFDAVKETFKSDIKDAELRVADIQKVLRRKGEEREVEVEERMCYAAKVVQEVRLDTNEVTKQRPMKLEETQDRLPSL